MIRALLFTALLANSACAPRALHPHATVQKPSVSEALVDPLAQCIPGQDAHCSDLSFDAFVLAEVIPAPEALAATALQGPDTPLVAAPGTHLRAR